MFYRSLPTWAAIMLAASSVSALEIELFEIAPLTPQQLAAFETAADRWENTFRDPITVKVNIGFDNLPSGVLGSTLTQRTTHSYSSVRTAMFNDASGSVEKSRVNSLPLSSLPVLEVGGAGSESMVTMATANAKALGLGTGLDPVYGGAQPNGADGRILFANAFAGVFDYEPSNGISPTLTDFVGVATHEIGHLLGFFSMTDVQDNPPNNGFNLHPNTLDLWRFNETGGAHAVGTETRRVTAGPAEYYDGGLNNRPFSRGVFDASSDPVCGTGSGFCQASHWRDDLGNLMDPTISAGVAGTIQPNDVRALDYVGYDRSFIFAFIPKKFLYGWFKWPDIGPPDPGPLIPVFGGAFDEFAPPPEFDALKPPFEPDMAVRVGMDFGVEGMENRGGLGAIQFQDEEPYKGRTVAGIEGDQFKGEQILEPEREPFETLPPVIKDLFIVSDVRGKPFTARAVLSELGAELDPSLGEFGGYRIPIALDGEGDDVRGDVDGTATLIMLATDKGGIPDPERENLFVIDQRALDNSLVVFDAAALGVPETPLLGDMNNDGNVDGLDVDRFVTVVLKGSFFVNADMNQDGQVNGLDVDPFVAAVLAGGAAPVPEPSTLLLAAVAGLLGLLRGRLTHCSASRASFR